MEIGVTELVILSGLAGVGGLTLLIGGVAAVVAALKKK